MLKATTRAPLKTIIRGALPYIVILFLFLGAMLLFPGLATFLPRTAGYS